LTIVPLLLAWVAGNGQALYRCGGDRVARPECCCPEAVESTPVPVTAVVSGACCCGIEPVAAAPVEVRALANGFESVKTFPAALVVISDVMGLSASRLAARASARSPRPPDPSTLLALKTSFLL
jgi:hypothetical protein